MHRNLPQALILATFCLLGGRGLLDAQDIELLGKIHGTRPPQAYYDLMDRDPGVFQFGRALFRRGLGQGELPQTWAPGQSLLRTDHRAVAQAMARDAQRAPVAGTFNFPLVLGLFSDSDPVLPGYRRADVQAEFWDGPQANSNAVGTIPEFYHEISGGRVTLTGTTLDWESTPLSRADVTAGVSGLGSGSRVGEFIVRALEAVDDGTVDWGHFDNDGPDGIPNSGDDDGYVDILAVMHPTPGGECSNSDRPNRIWSHRWTLKWNAIYYGSAWDPSVRQSILANGAYVTQTHSANDSIPFVKIDDYTIQPVMACSGIQINYIGVFAHELGHGFGLPDLYVTGGSHDHEGIGNWGLMGTGSWGCNGGSAWSPCHMSPWSKEVLGWVDIQTLPAGTDLGTLVLPPVETSGEVVRVNSQDGSAEYLLVENRQRIGFDEHLYEPGLLIWHIDPHTIGTSAGGINNNPDRMGVWLRQADGLNELGKPNGGRGDRGDPFPGSSNNTAFHAGSTPGSWGHGGSPMGVTFLDIAQVGDAMSFRALTRFQTLTLRSETVQGTPGLIAVDGFAPPVTEWNLESSPFQHLTIEAAPGEPISTGRRWGFRGWTDGAPRVREFTTQLEDASLTATYGGMELHLDVRPTSPAQGIAPGSVVFEGGDGTGWAQTGESVLVTAQPRTGFEFLEWTGPLAGAPNPVLFTPTEPLAAEALFGVTFSAADNPETVNLVGGVHHSLSLTAENANLPVTWRLLSGVLPRNLALDQSGAITGIPLARGNFPLTLRAIDAIGLDAFLPLTVVVDDPEIPWDALASAFLHSGPALDESTRAFLDNEGNANDAYDLGDLRAYVLRNPDLATTGDLLTSIEFVVSLGRISDRPAAGLRPPGGEVKREEGP